MTDIDLCECDRPDFADDPHRHKWEPACVYWIDLAAARAEVADLRSQQPFRRTEALGAKLAHRERELARQRRELVLRQAEVADLRERLVAAQDGWDAARAELADRDRRLAAVEALADEYQTIGQSRIPSYEDGAVVADDLRAALGDPDSTLAEVRAQAWDEGYEEGGADEWTTGDPHTGNPYRALRTQDGA